MDKTPRRPKRGAEGLTIIVSIRLALATDEVASDMDARAESLVRIRRDRAGGCVGNSKRGTQMICRTVRTLLFALVLAPASALEAQDASAGDPVERRLAWALAVLEPGAEIDPPAVFTSAFIERIPSVTIVQAIQETAEQTGGLDVARITERYEYSLIAAARARSDSAWWRIEVFVEQQEPYKITRLLYTPDPALGAPALTSWTQVDSVLDGFEGRVALGAYEVGPDDSLMPVHTRNAGEPLAVGSAFKLWVLGAVARRIEAGDLDWDDTIAIREEWKSLPGGQMQNLPDGEGRPVRYYATEMIRISDNTATDHLVRVVGRPEVEAFMAEFSTRPELNQPFLLTREFFLLKLAAPPELRDRYAAASTEERRALLEDSLPLLEFGPDLQEPSSPVAIETIEFFATASDLCRTLVHLATMSERPGLGPTREALTQNPGVPWPVEAWSEVAYKGGSEVGVLNTSWLVTRADGRRFCLVVTTNDPEHPIDVDRFLELAPAVQGLLARE